MVKELETRRFAEYVDNNLDTFLPGALSLWTQHHNLFLKSLQQPLMPFEIEQMNQLAQGRIQAEKILIPYLVSPQKNYHIYDIESVIQKNRWMPKLIQARSKGKSDFFAYPFTDQIRAVLLYATTQIDDNTMQKILTTPTTSETVRFTRQMNLLSR